MHYSHKTNYSIKKMKRVISSILSLSPISKRCMKHWQINALREERGLCHGSQLHFEAGVDLEIRCESKRKQGKITPSRSALFFCLNYCKEQKIIREVVNGAFLSTLHVMSIFNGPRENWLFYKECFSFLKSWKSCQISREL